MQDAQSTVFRMKEEVLALCRRKGWGVDGVQNPQHVAVAMTVEVLELLEVFGKAREAGREALSPRQLAEAAEEMADVTMYGLQLAYTLNIDLARGISSQASDDITPLAELKRLAGKRLAIRIVRDGRNGDKPRDKLSQARQRRFSRDAQRRRRIVSRAISKKIQPAGGSFCAQGTGDIQRAALLFDQRNQAVYAFPGRVGTQHMDH